MAEALATKNSGLMKLAVGTSIERASEAALNTPVDVYLEEWSEALGIVFEKEVNLHDILISGNDLDIKILRDGLQDSRIHQFALEDDSYIRLLQTIALCTLPDKGLSSRHATNPRLRKNNSLVGLFALSVNILDGIASAQPGLRKLREGLRAGEENIYTVDEYLARLQKSEIANNALTEIDDLVLLEDIKQARESTLNSLIKPGQEVQNIEVLAHLLTWEILPHNHFDIEQTKEKLKDHAKRLSESKRTSKSFEEKWDESRLDALFSIASQEAQKGRSVQIFISSAFNNSREFYVAAEFNSLDEPEVKIVIADNPMNDNAIYMVDESHTAIGEDGFHFKWKQVLGTSKRIARHRGAKRRFHVGEWKKHTEYFCITGIGKIAWKGSQIKIIDESPEIIDKKDSEEPKDTKDINVILEQIEQMRKALDTLSKTILDKNTK
jgi:hypothetical protein